MARQNLRGLASSLSSADIEKIVEIKKQDEAKASRLLKKYASLQSQLAKLEKEIIKITGESPGTRKNIARKAKKVVRKKAKTSKKKVAKKTVRKSAGKRAAKKSSKVGISDAINQILSASKKPMNVAAITEQLPKTGYRAGTKDIQKIKNRVGAAVASSQLFKKKSRGLYAIA